MPHRGLDVEGTWVTPHLQRYHCEAEGGLSCGEILCRPQGAEDPSLFFSCLSTQSHFSVLAWLLELQSTLDEQLNSHVSINVSNMILAVQPVRERFLAMLWAAPRPAVLEFTEVYRMPPSRTANSLLHEIRLIGHRTALDDFGSRDVDMSLLYDFDFDIVKIDRSQIVVNLQKPLHEIWLAARSGGFHYRFDGARWMDTKGHGEFFEHLTRCATEQAGRPLAFSAQ
jgi:CyaY protein